jgi:hypothetical protein
MQRAISHFPAKTHARVKGSYITQQDESAIDLHAIHGEQNFYLHRTE